MDSGMIGKIEKAMRYAQEPERINFQEFKVNFEGDNGGIHHIVYRQGAWECDCNFFKRRGVCSHTMTMERVFRGMVVPAEAVPMPA
jgi:hypothetical protein